MDGGKIMRFVNAKWLVLGLFFLLGGCKLLDRDANYISRMRYG